MPEPLYIECILAEMLPGRSQLGPGMTTLEQYPAKVVLHRLDASTHGGLGNVQVFGGAVEIPTVGNFQEGADMVDFHV